MTKQKLQETWWWWWWWLWRGAYVLLNRIYIMLYHYYR